MILTADFFMGNRHRRKGALGAPFVLRWGIFERCPQDDPTVDRAGFKLKRVALSVLVRPRCAHFVPEGFLAPLRDVPGQKVGCV